MPNFTFFKDVNSRKTTTFLFFSCTLTQFFSIQLQKNLPTFDELNVGDGISATNFWNSANLLFKWRFRSRRRRSCLTSLLKPRQPRRGGVDNVTALLTRAQQFWAPTISVKVIMRSSVKGGCVIGVYFPVSTVIEWICPATQTLRKGTCPYDNVKNKLSNARALSNTPTDARVLILNLS